MLEKKERTKYICIKAVNVPRQMLCLNIYYHNQKQASVGRDGSWGSPFPRNCGLQVWGTQRNNSISLFTTVPELHSYDESMNTWKNDFTQTGLRKAVWPQGQGTLPLHGEVYSQSFENGECVCVHICVCVYIQISIYINNHVQSFTSL